jgi:hypothetical protein
MLFDSPRISIANSETPQSCLDSITIRTARSRSSALYFEGRAMRVILPTNQLSGLAGAVQTPPDAKPSMPKPIPHAASPMASSSSSERRPVGASFGWFMHPDYNRQEQDAS